MTRREATKEANREARARVREARLAAAPDTFAFLDRNADAVLPVALDELREDLNGRLRPGVDSDYTAHAMVAAGLQIGRVMLSRNPVSVDEATAFAAGLFRPVLR